MATVKPGSIASILVCEETPRPSSGDSLCPGGYGNNAQNILRILGQVPVEPDGSAHFEAPAMRSLVFTLLAKDGTAIKTMRSWTGVMPGERSSCIGCHEYRAAAIPDANPIAARKPPCKIQPFTGIPAIIDFNRDIQPILTAKCQPCHNPTKREGGLSLVGHAGLHYTHAYSDLIERGWVKPSGIGEGRDKPYSAGSATAKLLPLLAAGHQNVQMTNQELLLFRLWIDSGAFYAGTYGSLRQGKLFEAENRSDPKQQILESALPAKVFAERCDRCHLSGARVEFFPWPVNSTAHVISPLGTRDSLVDLSQADQSLLIRAPLSRQAGGLGLCRNQPARSSGAKTTAPSAESVSAEVFKDLNDPDLQVLLQGLKRLEDWHHRNPRFYEPKFVPAPAYVAMLKLYKVLPASWDPAQPLDPYQTDELYFQSVGLKPKVQPQLPTR